MTKTLGKNLEKHRTSLEKHIKLGNSESSVDEAGSWWFIFQRADAGMSGF